MLIKILFIFLTIFICSCSAFKEIVPFVFGCVKSRIDNKIEKIRGVQKKVFSRSE